MIRQRLDLIRYSGKAPRPRGVDPGEQGEAISIGVVKPDLAIAFLTVVERHAHLDPQLHQSLTFKVQFSDRKDKADLARNGGLAPPLTPCKPKRPVRPPEERTRAGGR